MPWGSMLHSMKPACAVLPEHALKQPSIPAVLEDAVLMSRLENGIRNAASALFKRLQQPGIFRYDGYIYIYYSSCSEEKVLGGRVKR
jgi:hypothetical protein